MLAFLYKTKILYFVNLLIITNIMLYLTPKTSSLDFSNLNRKSIAINYYSLVNIYNSYNLLYSLYHLTLFNLYF